jgi:hypothetical protein
MTDTEAIAPYVAAGNPREDWAALDDRDRWPWRKMALEMGAAGGLEDSPLTTTSAHVTKARFTLGR